MASQLLSSVEGFLPASLSDLPGLSDLRSMNLNPREALNSPVGIALLAGWTLLCLPKLLLFGRGIVFMLLSNEKKGMKKAPDAKDVEVARGPDGSAVRAKTVVFIRHGMSEWNLVFNEGKLFLLPRLIAAIVRELFKCPSRVDSVFLDSPLSRAGEAQAEALQRFLECYQAKGQGAYPDRVVSCLRGEERAASHVLVSSNLRRALQTGIIALWPRLVRGQQAGNKGDAERVKVLSSLQEMSRNVDTNALAGKGALPTIPGLRGLAGWDGAKAAGAAAKPDTYGPHDIVDASTSHGNKGLFSKGAKRMDAFAAWCLGRPEDVVVVAAGHSLWFKNFFKLFLPSDAAEDGGSAGSAAGRRLASLMTTKKMKNCAVVSFVLEEGTTAKGKVGYRIDPDSIGNVYGGLEKVSGGADGAGAGPSA